MKEYALYKGENILEMGTIAFIARKIGVKRKTISFYKTQAYKNRVARRKTAIGNSRLLVEIDMDGDDQDGKVFC